MTRHRGPAHHLRPPDTQNSCWLLAVSGDGATEVQFSRNQSLAVADIDDDGIGEIVTNAGDQRSP